ncbi:glycosyltransferase family 2 protein [candidate division TA06 bacterium]|nr:glycosyltransferase family 2 protein [candidate division TA06 bacterium]
MRVAVLIPAYNVAGDLSFLLDSLAPYGMETIVVDDGSGDGTSEVARKAGSIVLQQEKNQGKGRAQRRGFTYILEKGYDAVLTMDGDGQHDPGAIPLFLEKIKEKDLILGTRDVSLKTMPILRYGTNFTTSLAISLLSKQKIRDSQTGYRLIRREVLENVVLKTSNYQTESEILIEAARRGYTFGFVPIKTIYGKEKSHINPYLDSLRAIHLFLMSLWR